MASPLRIGGLALDTRQIRAGDGFVALAGAQSHGLDYLEQAASAGAAAVVVDAADAERLNDINTALPSFAVDGLRARLPDWARAVSGDVDERLALYGVTGTDGKTSTAVFLAQLLHTDDAPCGVLGTLGAGFLDQLEPGSHTTADVFSTYRALADVADRGAQCVAMEVSSHALDQARVGGLSYTVGALTNVGRDHLDYHGTLEHYIAAKRKLFEQHAARAVFNLDDPVGARWFAESADAIGYSTAGDAKARWRGAVLALTATGMRCRIEVGAELSADCELPVLGRFNLSNVLCACAMADAAGRAPADVVSRLSALASVVGRLECLRAPGHAVAVIDYAHTEQALRSAVLALREHVSGTLWCVFGCGGDRDPGKRPGMARAACLADRVVLTTDNPRSESPEAIARDAAQGLVSGHPVETILDRRAAIDFALHHASSSDCVLIAGKGHEPYQEIRGQRIPFSDHAVVWAHFGGAA
ncbi:MAG: UDP-N-acetylmuramoyl-L-alanyl-D-glutamate--2,6-diaminopimelate ligase [Pseudomonadota bacterium]